MKIYKVSIIDYIGFDNKTQYFDTIIKAETYLQELYNFVSNSEDYVEDSFKETINKIREQNIIRILSYEIGKDTCGEYEEYLQSIAIEELDVK